MKNMMKNHLRLVALFLLAAFAVQAQPQQRLKIALFAPLYLDSAFDANNNYRFDKAFPKFLNPGLEFYQGAQAAIDSLSKVGAPLEVFVFDSRSQEKPLNEVVNSRQMENIDLMIGHASATEARLLADVAARKKVPFISATLPNDANVMNNPYYVILNSTLRTHAEGIYRHVQKTYANDKIIVFRKSGTQEDQLKEYFQEINKTANGTALRIQFVDIGNAWSSNQVLSVLDSTKRNIIIAGSLDESFGSRLAQSLSLTASKYPVTLIGMPTWEAINFSKPEFKGLEVVYTTPFNYSRPTALSTRITNDFTARVEGRPTDMYYRGYETMLRFGLLLLDTKKDIASNLSRKGNYIFTQFDIQPVFLKGQNQTLDYFENKKLYFVRVSNGVKSIQ
jgi:ABC-type branched-subunit amino acid transport system substrate-binding protein